MRPALTVVFLALVATGTALSAAAVSSLVLKLVLLGIVLMLAAAAGALLAIVFSQLRSAG